MSSDEDTSVQLTQSTLGKYVTKPNLSDKLLKKPPFRFIHDIVCVVIKDTGFLKGLFTDDELVSANVKERDAKVLFLNKLITAVKTTTKADLKVRSSKIIAGLEPIETNKLLQAIARAIDQKIDSTQYVKSLSETQKEKHTKSRTSSNKDKSKETRSVGKSSIKSTDDSKSKSKTISKEKSASKEPQSSTKSTSKTVSEKSVREKRALEKKSSKDSVPSTDRKRDNKSKSVEKLPTKISPKEKEQKSPKTIEFETIKENQNLKTEDPAEVLEVIAVINNIEEIENNDGIDLSTRKNFFEKSNEIDNTEPKDQVKPMFERPKTAKISKSATQKIKDNHIVAAKQDSIEIKEEQSTPNVSNNVSVLSEHPTPKPRPPSSIAQPIVAPSRPRSSLRPPSARPGTARPAAPRLRLPSALPPSDRVVANGNVKVVVEQYKGKGGQVKDDDDDEETVVVQETPEDQALSSTINNLNDAIVSADAAASKSHLVGQIMAQVGQEDPGSSARGGKQQVQVFQGDKSVAELGTSLQTVTLSANTLGQLMGYLHEDMDAMRAELEHWSQVGRTTMAAADKRRKELAERARPLRDRLQEIEEEIQRQKEEIATLECTIHSDQRRIDALLRREVAGVNDGEVVPMDD